MVCYVTSPFRFQQPFRVYFTDYLFHYWLAYLNRQKWGSGYAISIIVLVIWKCPTCFTCNLNICKSLSETTKVERRRHAKDNRPKKELLVQLLLLVFLLVQISCHLNSFTIQLVVGDIVKLTLVLYTVTINRGCASRPVTVIINIITSIHFNKYTARAKIIF